MNLIDTANYYRPGVSERMIAETLHRSPAGLVIATKGLLHPPGKPQRAEGTSLEILDNQVDGSLQRPRLERIDLYQLARIGPGVPAEDQVGALTELRGQGKIRQLGLSEASVSDLKAAQKIVPIVSVQNCYNLAERAWESVLDYCEHNGLGFLPWFPIGAANWPTPAELSAISRSGTAQHRRRLP